VVTEVVRNMDDSNETPAEEMRRQAALLTYLDVACRLKCCVRKVRDSYVKTGLLRVVHVGRNVRFTEEDYATLVQKLRGDFCQAVAS
jgi:hypothetical protein